MLANRVRETSTTTGTGALTLLGAVQTFQSFAAAFALATSFYYVIVNRDVPGEWEEGIGSLSGGTVLARGTVLDGANGTSLVNFSAGTKDVAVTYPAQKAVYRDGNGDVGVVAGSAPRDLWLSRHLYVAGVIGAPTGFDLRLGAQGAGPFFGINAAGTLYAVTDGVSDVGSPGAYRPRDLWLSRDLHAAGTAVIGADPGGGAQLRVGGTITANGGVSVTAGGASIVGNSAVSGTLSVSGGVNVTGGGLSVAGTAAVSGGATIGGSVVAQGSPYAAILAQQAGSSAYLAGPMSTSAYAANIWRRDGMRHAGMRWDGTKLAVMDASVSATDPSLWTTAVVDYDLTTLATQFYGANHLFGAGAGVGVATVLTLAGGVGARGGLNLRGSGGAVTWQQAGHDAWLAYTNGGADTNWYLRDLVNVRMQMTVTPGTTSVGAVTQFASRLVAGDTDYGTALSAGGDIAFVPAGVGAARTILVGAADSDGVGYRRLRVLN